MNETSDSKAVFLDRDGTLVELIYDASSGYIDSAVRASQIRLIPGAAEALKRLKGAGYKLIVISNQPGVAKGRISPEEFEEARKKLIDLLHDEGTSLDAEYYCLHHPNAQLPELRVVCDCRKPKPGLILRAAREHGLDLNECYMVGDDIMDVKAGKAAGCRTILLAHVTGLLLNVLQREGLEPDSIAGNLNEASSIIVQPEPVRTGRRSY